jgi:signal transduction histidine kinase
MIVEKQQHSPELAALPDIDAREVGQGLLWVGLMAGGVACGAILVHGVLDGVPLEAALTYAGLALVYLVLTLIPHLRWRGTRWLWQHLGVYLLITGLVCMALQALSGETFLQPLIFTVPIVDAALVYSVRRSALVCAGYLGLMNLGILLSDENALVAHLFPTIGYTTLMILIVAFTRLSVEQLRARRRADQLAADLARQRDYLARLSQITATLTRDLDLTTVLEQVASTGCAFAQADRALVWLREEATHDAASHLRLAASVPHEAPRNGSAAERWDVESIEHLEAQASSTGLVLPLVFKGVTIGALELHGSHAGAFGDEDARLLQPFADAAAVAIENARLYEQAHLSATLAERNRLARELHDTIAQGLTAITMQLEAAQRSFDRDALRTRARLGRAHELAHETLDNVRRSVWTLAAPLVDGQALSEALDELTQRFAERTGLPARYQHCGPSPQLGHAAATQVLRLVQEALQNVEKHARATQVGVASQLDEAGFCIQVRDNGVGFDQHALPKHDSDAAGGFGLVSLRERARLAAGTLQVESTPGMGTCLTLTIPARREL